MKVYKDPNSKKVTEVFSCSICPLKHRQTYQPNPISYATKRRKDVCLGIYLTFQGRYGLEGYHPSIYYAYKHGGFLPDCPLKDV